MDLINQISALEHEHKLNEEMISVYDEQCKINSKTLEELESYNNNLREQIQNYEKIRTELENDLDHSNRRLALAHEQLQHHITTSSMTSNLLQDHHNSLIRSYDNTAATLINHKTLIDQVQIE